jgi:hypothetical protein
MSARTGVWAKTRLMNPKKVITLSMAEGWKGNLEGIEGWK